LRKQQTFRHSTNSPELLGGLRHYYRGKKFPGKVPIHSQTVHTLSSYFAMTIVNITLQSMSASSETSVPFQVHQHLTLTDSVTPIFGALTNLPSVRNSSGRICINRNFETRFNPLVSPNRSRIPRQRSPQPYKLSRKAPSWHCLNIRKFMGDFWLPPRSR
jgi:hypothetical protein